jgi:ABC-type transport system substrate-binding protein
MAQAQLDKEKLKKNYKDSSTNTDDKNIVITLSHSKSVTVYYSKAYKEYVVSFNLGAKKFIITKKKWLYLRNFLEQIDSTITNQ